MQFDLGGAEIPVHHVGVPPCFAGIPAHKARTASRNDFQNSRVTNSNPTLLRAIGRRSLAALTVNSMIGSGIFGLPSKVAGLTGTASPIAVLIAGAATGIIMACYAELASYFTHARGPYLYGREAFGRLTTFA